MFCPKCGKETAENQAFCASCGAPLTLAATPGGPAVGISPKSRLATAIFAFPWLIGQFGVHRFYIGKTGTAVLMLILTIIGYATIWLLVGLIPLAVTWVWALIDFILVVAGKMTDSKGLPIEKW